jgi:hypothetical protein
MYGSAALSNLTGQAVKGAASHSTPMSLAQAAGFAFISVLALFI